ncbi:MAG: hypothetical protein JW810_06100 [Sedimentisphaerales bacterium]|nr:hypothetical protein [Sedimentisphaerales bacterium]
MVFADAWREFFGYFNLLSLPDFYDLTRRYKQRQLAVKKAVVTPFALERDGQSFEFFIKWYLRVPWKNRLSVWRRCGRRCSQAQAEWRTAGALARIGIGAYEPACYGQEGFSWREGRSFLVTRRIEALSLGDHIRNFWPEMSPDGRRDLLAALALFIRRMHDQGFYFPDLYAKHIFVEAGESGEYRFRIIDLQRVHRGGGDRANRVRDLGALNQSLPASLVDARHRERFIRAYVGDGRPEQAARLLRQVQKRARHLGRYRDDEP